MKKKVEVNAIEARVRDVNLVGWEAWTVAWRCWKSLYLFDFFLFRFSSFLFVCLLYTSEIGDKHAPSSDDCAIKVALFCWVLRAVGLQSTTLLAYRYNADYSCDAIILLSFGLRWDIERHSQDNQTKSSPPIFLRLLPLPTAADSTALFIDIKIHWPSQKRSACCGKWDL